MSNSDSQTSQQIGIIGAGLAGSAAAQQLVALGHSVTLFDKARGVSGRMSFRRRDGYEFDHGAQYFTVRDAQMAARLPSWISTGIVAEWDAKIVSLKRGEVGQRDPQQRYVAVPGMNALAKELCRGIKTYVETRIEKLRRAANRWHLTDTLGQTFNDFDALLLNMPAPQAAELIAGLSPLEENVQACQMSPCWTVMLAYPERLETEFDAAFVYDNPLSWIARNSSKPGRPDVETWVLHGSPEWSKQHLEAEPSDVINGLVSAFFEATGLDRSLPMHVHAHRWRYALPHPPMQLGCLWDEENRLALAGDWCNGARVEGAFLSGLAAAEMLDQSLR